MNQEHGKEQEIRIGNNGLRGICNCILSIHCLKCTVFDLVNSCLLSACQTTTSNMGNNNKTHNINIGGVLYTSVVVFCTQYTGVLYTHYIT